MEKLVIQGGHPLDGRVKVSGAKKSTLALISASILANDCCMIENVPRVQAVNALLRILTELGIANSFRDSSTLVIDPRCMIRSDVMARYSTEAIYLIGAMLGRFTHFSIAEPPDTLDQHFKGFRALGADVLQKEGVLYISAPQLTGTMIYLDQSDPTLTINLMLASVRAQGTTVIKNAAKDPEVVDLATYLSALGAEVRGAGTSTIRIEGERALRGCIHAVIPDRMEAGIYMILAASTRGRIRVDRIIPNHLRPITAKLREMGVDVREEDEAIVVSCHKHPLTSVDVKTFPYPGFPVGLEQPFVVLLTQAKGTSIVTTDIRPQHVQIVEHLKKMGANIKVSGRTVVIEGVTPLKGQEVTIHDPSLGIALLIASLSSSERIILSGMEVVEQTYPGLIKTLVKLGAVIQKYKN